MFQVVVYSFVPRMLTCDIEIHLFFSKGHRLYDVFRLCKLIKKSELNWLLLILKVMFFSDIIKSISVCLYLNELCLDSKKIVNELPFLNSMGIY